MKAPDIVGFKRHDSVESLVSGGASFETHVMIKTRIRLQV